MNALFLYAFKVIICSAILYAYYFIALRNNKFHQWNRYYLLLAVAASLIIPLLHLSLPFNFTADDNLQTLTVYTAGLQDITVKASGHPGYFYFSKNTIILFIYGAVAALMAGRFFYSLLKIKKYLRHASNKKVADYIFINAGNNNSPHSFFKYIFWSPEIDLQTPHGKKILQHELVHVREKHSADKLIMEIVGVIFWFNPFFYLIKRELDLVHEFIADNKTSDGRDDQFYRELLLFHVLNRPQFAGANYFFHHKIKRRIFMLTLSKQPRFSYLRRMLVLPLAFILLCAFSVARKNKLADKNNIKNNFTIQRDTILPDNYISRITANDIKSVRVKKNDSVIIYLKNGNQINTTENKFEKLVPPPPPPASSSNGVARNKIFQFVEQMPRFPGSNNDEESNENLRKYLSVNVHYPPLARENEIQGTVVVTFVVTNNGSIQYVKVVGKHKGGGLEEEAMRLVKNMPRWIPGKQNGKNVNVQFTIPVRFVLDDGTTMQSKTLNPLFVSGYKQDKNVKISSPLFGGAKNEEESRMEIQKFLHRNITYPSYARNHNEEGTVLVKFIVTSTGDIVSVHPADNQHSSLDSEAIRVVKLMPKWAPGKKNGQAVNVEYTLPVIFSLQ